jgi:hypothetical protein
MFYETASVTYYLTSNNNELPGIAVVTTIGWCCRGRLSAVDLLVLTSLEHLLCCQRNPY